MDVIKFYNDDFEILEILKQIPALPVMPFYGLTVIQYIDKYSVNKDFGVVFVFKDMYHIVYKYGMSGDSGLLLLQCRIENVKYLFRFIDHPQGTKVFPNREIFSLIRNSLVILSGSNIL